MRRKQFKDIPPIPPVNISVLCNPKSWFWFFFEDAGLCSRVWRKHPAGMMFCITIFNNRTLKWNKYQSEFSAYREGSLYQEPGGFSLTWRCNRDLKDISFSCCTHLPGSMLGFISFLRLIPYTHTHEKLITKTFCTSHPPPPLPINTQRKTEAARRELCYTEWATEWSGAVTFPGHHLSFRDRHSSYPTQLCLSSPQPLLAPRPPRGKRQDPTSCLTLALPGSS